jgi:hypothetical protein
VQAPPTTKARPPPVWQTGCEQLAAIVMGTADPTRGGRLAVTVGPVSGTTYVFSSNPADGAAVTRVDLVGACAVELVGAGQLTGTVIGLGESPLPVG